MQPAEEWTVCPTSPSTFSNSTQIPPGLVPGDLYNTGTCAFFLPHLWVGEPLAPNRQKERRPLRWIQMNQYAFHLCPVLASNPLWWLYMTLTLYKSSPCFQGSRVWRMSANKSFDQLIFQIRYITVISLFTFPHPPTPSLAYVNPLKETEHYLSLSIYTQMRYLKVGLSLIYFLLHTSFANCIKMSNFHGIIAPPPTNKKNLVWMKSSASTVSACKCLLYNLYASNTSHPYFQQGWCRQPQTSS